MSQPAQNSEPAEYKRQANQDTKPTNSANTDAIIAQTKSKVTAAIVSGIIVLALIVAALIYAFRTKPETAEDAVAGYFAALEASDASSAKSFLSSELNGDDSSLLTQEMLDASQAKAKITEVVVRDSQTTDNQVEVAYKLGEQQQSDAVKVIQAQDGTYKIAALASFDATTITTQQQLTLNGIKINSGQLLLFPGEYELGVDHPYLSVFEPMIIASSDDVTSNAALELSSAANEPFREATKAKVEECKTRTDPQAPDCGWTFNVNVEGIDTPISSVACNVADTSSLDSAEFLLLEGQEEMASANISLAWSCTGQIEGYGDAATTSFNQTYSEVDFTDPNNLQVRLR